MLMELKHGQNYFFKFNLDISIKAYGRLARCLNHHVTRHGQTKGTMGSPLVLVSRYFLSKNKAKRLDQRL